MHSRAHHSRAWLFVAPAAAHLLLFGLIPLAQVLWMSLHHWHLLDAQPRFAAFDNYFAIAGDPHFRHALLNTFWFALLAVPLSVGSALLVAALAARALPGVRLFRTLLFIPAVCSQVALCMLWTWILMPSVGPLNSLWRGVGGILNGWMSALGQPLSESTLAALGFRGDTAFLERPDTALASLVLMFAWIGLGPRMVLFVAGIQSVPATLLEAAAIDGCGAWHRFTRITLPLLLPTGLFVVVTTTIAAFQFFTPIQVLTRGGPQRSTDVVLYHIYTEAWMKLEVGMASAMSLVLLVAVLVVAAVQLRLMRREGITEN